MTKRAKAKPKRKASNGDLTPSKHRKPRYTNERVAGLAAAWQPGQSGNPAGRPLGARSRLNEAFLDALGETWAKYGPGCLEWLAQNDRAMFVQVVASLTPRNAKLDVDLGTKPIYLIRDHPLTEDEWVAKYCDPDLKPSELQ